MSFLASLEKRSKLFWEITGFMLIGVVGVLDFLTGYELAFSLFYLLPVSLVAWLVRKRLGILASFASACVWLSADVAAGSSYSSPLIYAWNTLIRLSIFIITALLLATIKRTLKLERELARTDFLTGAANARFFYDLLQIEIDRFQRYKHPFTLAYIDLDNFKDANDRFGHLMGDQILREVVSTTRKHMRKIDIVARLGGDEFAFLLPETDQEAARIALGKIQAALLAAMQQNNWLITFSIGVLTCCATPDTTDELVRITDELMYAVKRAGKNGLKYSTYAC